MKQVPVMTDRARVRSLTVLLDIIPNGVEFGQHYEHLSEKMRALDPERTGPLTVYLSRNSVSSIGIMDPDWRARFEAVRDLCLGSPAVTSLIVTD